MIKLIRRYPKAFALAVAFHIALGGFLVASVDMSPHQRMTLKAPSEEEIVQAIAVDEQAVQAEIDRLKRIEDKRKSDVDKLQRKADDARKAREKEQKQLAELERLRKIEAQKKVEVEKERLKIEQEKRQAQLEKEKIEQDRRIAEERKRQAEELAQRAREEAIQLAKEQQQQEEERLRRQRMAEEAQRLREQQQADRVAKSTVEKYTVLLKQKVEQNWREPTSATPGMFCTVLVRLSPVGDVLSAKVVKGSGNAVFDRSVETAVFQAAPFELPKDPAIFSKYFRELKFDFKPE